MTGRGGIEALLDLMDEAFADPGIEASNESQALITNLATVAAGQWRARPPGVERTIEGIALHAGACTVAYHAGEINHPPSQLGGDDRWRYVQLGFG